MGHDESGWFITTPPIFIQAFLMQLPQYRQYRLDLTSIYGQVAFNGPCKCLLPRKSCGFPTSSTLSTDSLKKDEKSTELNFWSSKPLVPTSMDTDFGGKGRNWRTRRQESKDMEEVKHGNQLTKLGIIKTTQKTLGQKFKEYQSFVHSIGVPCRS